VYESRLSISTASKPASAFGDAGASVVGGEVEDQLVRPVLVDDRFARVVGEDEVRLGEPRVAIGRLTLEPVHVADRVPVRVRGVGAVADDATHAGGRFVSAAELVVEHDVRGEPAGRGSRSAAGGGLALGG
jgi:hypothetical protein